ncbi:uncharacterized protein BX663DRAFT_564376 [Cokeromyces recurvatus]|uniref:uncharacterized protein n=1 Tax=Cokeromyces recurvatus TaxID=90255 RepID=UPI00221E9D19|nr:uncharacterized protein BX663DRAFT_564376 [Cokeromyces recurvatus]KAI7898899.1 hypothetical protein BX663DRAFT_564376 [Cokeromyces recurvatus]
MPSTRYQKLATISDSHHDNEGSSTTTSQQQSDLQDSFGESFDKDEDEDNVTTVTDRLLEYHQQDTSSSHNGIQPAILPISNDGVFANISAKPDNNKLEETPPTYEEAAADATPPYWQTTIITPISIGDFILVEGLPVGSMFSFFWNLIISASFQFVGFMLTYLLHTSHAAKQGSRAGLGVSLVQAGFYIRGGTLEDDEYYPDGGQSSSKTMEDKLDINLLSYLFMIMGWLFIFHSLAQYFKAKQMERIITSQPTTAEAMV